jgi:hypothetical protein
MIQKFNAKSQSRLDSNSPRNDKALMDLTLTLLHSSCHHRLLSSVALWLDAVAHEAQPPLLQSTVATLCLQV